MSTTGTAGGTSSTSEPAGYSSIISRVVGGIPVPASFARARINGEGDVIEESVYWPSIPASVMADATALAATLADPVRGSAFLSKLPTRLRNGRVVIVHSAPSSHTGFESFAAYEASYIGPLSRAQHFDATGTEVFLASEKPVTLPSNNRMR